MQDRYAGDIGDYGKIALLKALQRQGLSIGINWYRVKDLDTEKKSDGTFKQDDGRYQIPGKIKDCDPELANALSMIFHSSDRSIDALERAELIPDVIYYDKPITKVCRSDWHQAALNKLKHVDIVFLDPDNGMLVKSVKKGSSRSVKYAFYEEVGDYIKQNQSVLIYNHRCRKPEEQYFGEICERLQAITGIPAVEILKITFPKCSVRDYIAVPVSEEHSEKILQVFKEMAQGIWGKLGVCRIPKFK